MKGYEILLPGDPNRNVYGTSMHIETMAITNYPGIYRKQRHFEIPIE